MWTYRKFTFLSGMTVEIGWNSVGKEWLGYAVVPPGTVKYEIYSKVFSKRKRDLPRFLRLEIAKQKNHKVAAVAERINPPPYQVFEMKVSEITIWDTALSPEDTMNLKTGRQEFPLLGSPK